MSDRDESRPGPEKSSRTSSLELVAGGRDATVGRDGPDELCLVASTSSARTARHWVMNELAADGVFGADNQIVELLTGEIVANAALHGPAQGQIRVRVGRAGLVVRVAVRDESVAVPVVRHPEPTADSGRGLELVDSLATAWGIQQHGDGKTVWFSVDLESS